MQRIAVQDEVVQTGKVDAPPASGGRPTSPVSHEHLRTHDPCPCGAAQLKANGVEVEFGKEPQAVPRRQGRRPRRRHLRRRRLRSSRRTRLEQGQGQVRAPEHRLSGRHPQGLPGRLRRVCGRAGDVGGDQRAAQEAAGALRARTRTQEQESRLTGQGCVPLSSQVKSTVAPK